MIDEKLLIDLIESKTDLVFDEITEKALVQMIKEQPQADEWIPCEVEMPKDETLMYWTTHEDGSIIMHGYLKGNGFIYNWEVDDLEKRKRQGKVVAWMPIFKPQPYKKVGAE